MTCHAVTHTHLLSSIRESVRMITVCLPCQCGYDLAARIQSGTSYLSERSSSTGFGRFTVATRTGQSRRQMNLVKNQFCALSES